MNHVEKDRKKAQELINQIAGYDMGPSVSSIAKALSKVRQEENEACASLVESDFQLILFRNKDARRFQANVIRQRLSDGGRKP